AIRRLPRRSRSADNGSSPPTRATRQVHRTSRRGRLRLPARRLLPRVMGCGPPSPRDLDIGSPLADELALIRVNRWGEPPVERSVKWIASDDDSLSAGPRCGGGFAAHTANALMRFERSLKVEGQAQRRASPSFFASCENSRMESTALLIRIDNPDLIND